MSIDRYRNGHLWYSVLLTEYFMSVILSKKPAGRVP
jgi:hypothetical protein